MTIEFDATFFALVALILFIVAMWRFKVHEAVLTALDGRSAEIAKELGEARRLRQEAELLLADYVEKRRTAEAEALAIVANARDQAAAIASDMRATAEETIARRRVQAEQRIAQAEAQATAEVLAAVVDAAIDAAERSLRESATAQSQSQLVAAGVEELKRRFG